MLLDYVKLVMSLDATLFSVFSDVIGREQVWWVSINLQSNKVIVFGQISFPKINLEEPIRVSIYLQNPTIVDFLYFITWLHRGWNFEIADTSSFCIETLHM